MPRRAATSRFVDVLRRSSGSFVVLSERQHLLGTGRSVRIAGRIEPQRRRHVLDLGQVVQILQPEADQEFLGRAVEERPADDVLAADDLDQMPLQQRREHAGRVDAANLADLRGGDRLLVGDHRQRLERLHRQLLRRPLVEQAADPLVKLGSGRDLVAAGDLGQMQPAASLVVVLQRLDGGEHVFLGLVAEQLEQHLRRQRLGRREHERLDDRLQLTVVQARPIALGFGEILVAHSFPSRPSCPSCPSRRALEFRCALYSSSGS